MKYHNIQELPNNNHSVRKTIILILFFMTLTTFPLYLRNNPPLISLHGGAPPCDVFNGTWVPRSPDDPDYYTNDTCRLIIDEQNCLKFGRSDTDFLRWRWKPDGCDLPRFDAARFLDLVANKSLAFLGDSVGKNQMYSLLCLLAAHAGEPEDVSGEFSNNTAYFKRFVFRGHNFTVATLWAPFLVRAEESDPEGYSANSRMNLYLDEPNPAWSSQAAGFDYVVVSAGQWFFRPAKLHRNGTLLGCSNCAGEEGPTTFEAYREAFRTTFRELVGMEGYRGVTFLRTFSPSHFEGGVWNAGGRCERTQPYGREVQAEWYITEMRRVQVEELKEAREIGRKRGLEFRVMDTTRAMFMRPDGHPNFYGRSPHRNMSYADCVHWCVPGPVDLWNEILLYFMARLSHHP